MGFSPMKSRISVVVVVACYFLGACSTFDREPELFAAKAASASPLGAAGLVSSERGEVKTRDDIIFAPRSSDLPGEADYVITDAAQVLLKNKKSTARIEGHTDAMGREQANLDLSIQRAFAVRNALIAAGIAAYRLEPVGLGETRPIASNETTEGRTINRRVSIFFTE